MNSSRHQSRIAIERPGVLTRHGQTSECRVSDFTEQGFRLQTDVLPVVVGEVVHMTCALDTREEIECRIAVTYVHRSVFGAHIVEMSPEHQERLSRFRTSSRSILMGRLSCLTRPSGLDRRPVHTASVDWPRFSVSSA